MRGMLRSAAALAAVLLIAGAPGKTTAADEFTLTSGDFADGDYFDDDHVFNGFGCEGGNRSPSLAWSGAPAETKSFALTVYDPDAPTGSGWWHWVVVNLPPGTTKLPTGAGSADGANLPEGALQVRTDFGAPGYGDPCPPEGDHPHRYIFTIHALDLDSLDVTAESSPALVGFYLNFHTLATDSLMGLYKR